MATGEKKYVGPGTIWKRRADGRKAEKGDRVVGWTGQITVPSASGKRRYKTVSAESRGEVVDRLARIAQELRTGTFVDASKVTVGSYVTDWLQGREQSLSPSTLRSYRWLLTKHLIPSLGDIRVQALRETDIERALAGRLQVGLSARSITHARALLRAALNRAVRERLITQNPALHLDLPTVKRANVTSLTTAEARRFLEAVRGDRLEGLYTVGLGLGLRRGEMLGLRWSDVDLDARTLRVAQALQRADGRTIFRAPKSETSRRTIALPAPVADALREHRKRQVAEQLATMYWEDSGLVFTNTAGGPLDPTFVSKSFARALTVAGLRHVRLHDLRHSCASLLIASGISPREVAEMLGHSSTRLTLDTYSHVSAEALRGVADAMDRILGG